MLNNNEQFKGINLQGLYEGLTVLPHYPLLAKCN